MPTLTDEQWEYFKQVGLENEDFLKNIPEELDLKITRKLMQDPYAIPLLFDGIRRDTKDKIKVLDDMEENISHLNTSNEIKYLYKMLCFFIKYERKEDMDQWNYLEALALNQVEFRKDVSKIIKSIQKTKENSKVVSKLQNKLKQQDEDLKEFRKTKNYIKFTKRFFDERQEHKEFD
ncbi:hypothetical protein [Nitrosopumilus ureiphilus]|uniref:Uncharacterized protein n=1 Tax=Nitrosopumilus ureiphilus TaxID=1470067 RepID=A0A7D5R2E3_9ARCH|nr:hypothetical protein [Nitrosopumilus ureiphilus]QLH07416.1 hypothetical protein C5F50_10310 [Nitrosopumilus ureiphilus]